MLFDVVGALTRWPIVGRRGELEVFERVLGSAEHMGLVIYGRAGVGKTRLAHPMHARVIRAAMPPVPGPRHPAEPGGQAGDGTARCGPVGDGAASARPVGR
jgi:hypothetical protein